MATHWTDRRASKALLAHALRDSGWKLYGYHADASDSMTDYYSPAHWDGIATKGSAVVVVGQSSASDSGKTPEMRDAEPSMGPCGPCGGGGKELRDYAGSRSVEILTGAVHIDPGHKAGDPCRWCKGTGQREEWRTHPGETWPTFQANPKARNWHVEIGGRIVASGTGVMELHREEYDGRHKVRGDSPEPPEHWDEVTCSACGEVGAFGEMMRADCSKGRPKTAALVAKIEAAADYATPRPLTLKEGIPSTPTPPDGVTVREGKRPGYVELVFPAKPGPETRAALKGAGFRWAPSSACWYGKADALPELHATH